MWPICSMAWRIGDILDVHEQIEWIRDAGFDGVAFHASPGVPGQWRGVDPAEADEKTVARLRDQIAGFAMCEIHAPFAHTLKPGSPMTAVEGLLPTLDFAGAVGATVVTAHAALPATMSPACAALWRGALARLNASAQDNSVTVGLELTEEFDRLAELALPDTGVTLDIGHMYANEGRPLEPFGSLGEVVRHIAEMLVHVHVHDYDGVNDHIELGSGRVDIDDLLAALRETEYGGALCLELNPDLVSPEAMRRSLDWIRSRIEKLIAP